MRALGLLKTQDKAQERHKSHDKLGGFSNGRKEWRRREKRGRKGPEKHVCRENESNGA